MEDQDWMVRLHVDFVELDFHIDAAPDHHPAVLADALERASQLGLEPLGEDECEPELLEDGSVRIYLCPVTEELEEVA